MPVQHCCWWRRCSSCSMDYRSWPRERCAALGSPRSPNTGFSMSLLILPFCRSERCKVCPLLPTYVPLGRMQDVQVKKSGFTTPPDAEGARIFVVSLELNPCQLVWLKTLKASK